MRAAAARIDSKRRIMGDPAGGEGILSRGRARRKTIDISLTNLLALDTIFQKSTAKAGSASHKTLTDRVLTDTQSEKEVKPLKLINSAKCRDFVSQLSQWLTTGVASRPGNA